MRDVEEILNDVVRARSVNDIEALQRYADELQQHDTPLANAVADRSLGTVCLMRGEYASALTHYQRAIELSEQIGDRIGIARVTNNIGLVHLNTGDHERALEYFHRALALSNEVGDRENEASIVGNIAHVLRNTGDLTAALERYHQALAICEELGDQNGVAGHACNIGLTLSNIDDYPAALEYLHRSLSLSTELGNKVFAANAIVNIGNIYDFTGDYATALENYDAAVAMYEEIGDKHGLANAETCIGWTHQHIGDLTTALEHHRRAMAMHQELGEVQAAANDLCNIILVHLERGAFDEARPLIDTLDTMSMDDPVLRIWREQCRAGLQSGEGDHDAAATTLQRALVDANDHGLRSKAADVHKALRDLAQKRNDLAGYIEHNNEYTRITEEINGRETATKLAMQAKQREIDAREREHAQHLAVLHSTLPKEVAERVARGEVVNDHYDNATVIFLDIVGFTEISSSMSSQEVITLLDDVFTQCDAICARHGVTKIKTIGDSYMCVSFDSVINAALCALEMSRIRISHEVSHSVSHAEGVLPVSHSVSHNVSHAEGVLFRIGMHCGPVTAGVIGKERMQYDVWGDTVNVASRMESSGEAGRVHISEAFASELKRNTEYLIQNSISESRNQESHEVSHAVSHTVSHTVSHEVSHEVPLVTRHSSLVTIERGSIDIKGKGPMHTYWLEGA